MAKETIIDSDLLKEITAYCELNEEDTARFINALLKSAYMEVKYGDMLPGKKKAEPVKEEKAEEPKPVEEKQPEPTKNFFGGSKNKDLYGE